MYALSFSSIRSSRSIGIRAETEPKWKLDIKGGRGIYLKTVCSHPEYGLPYLPTRRKTTTHPPKNDSPTHYLTHSWSPCTFNVLAGSKEYESLFLALSLSLSPSPLLSHSLSRSLLLSLSLLLLLQNIPVITCTGLGLRVCDHMLTHYDR